MIGLRTKPTVFICYRRNDTQDFADRLYDTLSTRLGDSHVFMDIDSIAYGDDFEQTLQSKFELCTAMLVLIGPSWLTMQDGSGTRRLDDPADYVRREIEAGLQRPGVRVIPVLAHGAILPDPTQLPAPMVPLVKRQAIQLSREYFKPGVQRLLETLNDTAVQEDLSARVGIPQAQALLKQAGHLVQGMARPVAVDQSPTVAGDTPGPSDQRPAPSPVDRAVQPYHQTESFRSLVTIATLVLFFPAGLILIWTYSPWPPKTRRNVTWFVAGVLAFILLLSAMGVGR
jgi:hypothetical protein